MHKSTNAEKLFKLLGGVVKVADYCKVNKAIPSRWNSKKPPKGGKGKIPPQYNAVLIEAAKKAPIPEKFRPEVKSKKERRDLFMAEVGYCLDFSGCPTCGQPMPAGMRVDKRKLPK